jgi:hypothetical protein
VKNILSAISIILFLQMTSSGQFFSNTLIKTRPLKDLVALNPNLGFEKPVHKLFSTEIEFTYRNRSWEGSGGEGDFGGFYDSDGYKVMVGSRVYFGKTNKHLNAETQKAPFGWFAALQLGYSDFKIHNIRKVSFHGIYENNISLVKRWPELNILAGRQFCLSRHLSLECYAGPSINLHYYEKSTIISSETAEDIGKTMVRNYKAGWRTMPNVSITVGYRID